MKIFATLSILVLLLYSWKALGSAVYDNSYSPDKYDAHAAYQPEHDAGHVAYNQAEQDCHRKCMELIAQLEHLKLTHVTSPVIDMEGCIQHCSESNANGWNR